MIDDMAGSTLCLLLFAALFPGVLGQELDIDVGIGETAEFPLRHFINFTNSKLLHLIRVIWGKSGPWDVEILLNLTAGAPVQDVKVNETWQDRLYLLNKPDGIVAELRNVQRNDTGREMYYRYIQKARQGPKMYIILKIPPLNVTFLNFTDVGMDYVNMTWPQVEPLDSATIWYYVEHRRQEGVNTWHRTANISATDATDKLMTMRVERLLPGVWYEFRVVTSNRFGKSCSGTRKALTKGSQKRYALSGGAIGGIIGVVAFIVIAVAAVKLYQHCKKKKSNDIENQNNNANKNNKTNQNGEINLELRNRNKEQEQEDPDEPEETDRSILEPLLQYSGTGRGSEVEEGPGLTDRDNGSPDENQPQLNVDNSTETDAVSSSILDAAFEYRVALYYDENSKNMNGIKDIRATLERWGFLVYDLHRDGINSITDNYAFSVENCRHGIFFLPIKTQMAKFRFDKFLANKLREDDIPERNLIPISFNDGDLENTVNTVKVYLADAKALPYKNKETFDWRKLYKMLARPGCQFTVEVAKKQLGSDSMSVKDLAQKLDIPQQVVSNVEEEFEGVRAQKEELIRLWMGNMGPVPTQELGAVSRSNESDDMIIPLQPISSVEYENLLHNTKDSPSSDDNKEQEPRNHQLLQQVEYILSEATTPLQEQTAKELLDFLKGVKDWQDVQDCCIAIEEKLQLPNIEMLTADCARQLQLHESYEGMPDNRIAIHTTADGDCLFHAVGKLLRGGREEHTQLLRLGAVVFAVNHQKCIVDELYGELKRADEDSVGRFFAMISDGGQDKTGLGLEERLTDVVQEEARKTMNRGEYSGILPIKFLAGFVRSHILLYCQNPIDAYADYHNVLKTPCSCMLDSIPETRQLEVMLVALDTKRLNHFVGLVPTPDDRDLTETDGATNGSENTGEGSSDFDPSSQDNNESTHLLNESKTGSDQNNTETTPFQSQALATQVPNDDEQEMSMTVSFHDPVPAEDNMSTPLLPLSQPEPRMTSKLRPQMRVSQIPFSIRLNLTTQLSVNRDDGRDWRLLAERLGYNEYITFWDQRSNLPAEQLLLSWQTKSEATVERLQKTLVDLNMGAIAQILDTV